LLAVKSHVFAIVGGLKVGATAKGSFPGSSTYKTTPYGGVLDTAEESTDTVKLVSVLLISVTAGIVPVGAVPATGVVYVMTADVVDPKVFVATAWM